MVIVGLHSSWSSLPIIAGAVTVLLWTGIYFAKPGVRLIDSMRLQRSLLSNFCRTLDDCGSANDWWRSLKSHVFGAESDVPPLCSPGGVLFSGLMEKAELLSAWFDSKQSRDIVEWPQTCHTRPAFCWIAFKVREIERYLKDLDPNDGVDPSGCFPMFFPKTASILAQKLSRLFRKLLRSGEFPLEWRIADVTPIPNGLLLLLVCNYWPISITPIQSKVFESLISLRFGEL